MRPWYADDYRGWPVAPRNRQHPVRGSWLDPRRKEEYHPGIDISVRDDRPERGAPPGRTHRVYALEGGPVWHVWRQPPPGREGIVRIGHFTYGHVEPVVELGRVQPASREVLGQRVAGGGPLGLADAEGGFGVEGVDPDERSCRPQREARRRPVGSRAGR